VARDAASLIAMLKGNDLGARMEAALELGRMRAKAAVPALVEALGDREVSVLACWALGRIGDRKTVDRISVMLLSAKAPEERHEAALALGRIGDARGVKTLITALRKDKTPKVREECAEALGNFGTPDVVSALAKAVETDKSELVRLQAKKTLVELKLK